MPDPTPSRSYWRTGRKDMRTLAPDAFDSAQYIYAHFLYPPDDRPEMPGGWTRLAFYGVADDASDPQVSAEYVADLLNAREARIAELEAEVERLTKLNDEHIKAWNKYGGGDA